MKKDLGVKPYTFPMPVLMIATYGEESADELFNMGAAYYYLIENAAAAKPEPGPGAGSETGSAAETGALEE